MKKKQMEEKHEQELLLLKQEYPTVEDGWSLWGGDDK